MPIKWGFILDKWHHRGWLGKGLGRRLLYKVSEDRTGFLISLEVDPEMDTFRGRPLTEFPKPGTNKLGYLCRRLAFPQGSGPEEGERQDTSGDNQQNVDH
jgi:hypothetical protein